MSISAAWAWLSEAFPPKSKFTLEHIPDLLGKVIIVTGANTGIGKETARVLLSRNAKVYIAARDKAKSDIAIQELKNMTGHEAIFLKLDLADLKSVKAAAEEFQSKETQLDVLFNNAGVMAPPTELVTADGYDLQFGTNVLGHYYFTQLLLPVLVSTAKASPDGKVRVVNTSSSGHHFGGLNFNTFKDGPARRKQPQNFLYGQSKYGNVVFALELAKRYGDQGVVSTSLNPGNIRSELARHLPRIVQMIAPIILYSVSHGALTQLYAGTTAAGAELNGKYLIPWARVGAPLESTQDPELGKALWNWLEEQVKEI